MKPRVIGLGQAFAGDDAVGFAVTARLRALALPEVAVLDVADPTELIELLATPGPVVIVDALIGPSPGRVRTLDAHELASFTRASTHAVSVAEALAIARALHGPCDVYVVAVEVEAAVRGATTLSAPIAASVDRAVTAALALIDWGGRDRASAPSRPRGSRRS